MLGIQLLAKSHPSLPSCGAFLNVTSKNVSEWDDQISWLNGLDGLGHVEVWLEEGLSDASLRRLKRRLREWPVIVHGPFIDMSLATPWVELADISLRRASTAIRQAADLKAQVVTFHVGRYPVFEDRQQALERCVTRLMELPLDAGPRVCVENMPARGGGSRELLTTAADLAQVVAAVPSIGVTLDVGHCLQNCEDPIAAMELLGSAIQNVHLHDGVEGGRAHLPLGAGELHVEDVLAAAVRASARHVTLETLGQEDTTASWNALVQSGMTSRSAKRAA